MSDWLVSEGERRTTWLARIGHLPMGMASMLEYRRCLIRSPPAIGLYERDIVSSEELVPALPRRRQPPPSSEHGGLRSAPVQRAPTSRFTQSFWLDPVHGSTGCESWWLVGSGRLG